MNRLIIFLIAIIFSATAQGQSGAKIYTGLLLGYNASKVITPSGTVHSGWLVGIDARLNSDNMYFLVGGKYGTFDLLAQKSPKFINDNQLSFIKGRVGLGFDVIRLRRNIFLTSKLAGSVQIAQNYNRELLTQPGFMKINEGTAGLVGGIGVRIGIINLDLEYEYGLFNLYNEQPDTKMDFYSLMVGVNF